MQKCPNKHCNRMQKGAAISKTDKPVEKAEKSTGKLQSNADAGQINCTTQKNCKLQTAKCRKMI